MRVLGIDPGTRKTGWGVVTRSRQGVTACGFGVIAPAKNDSLPLRLRGIHDGLREVIAQHQPEAVAVEDIFFAKHPSAALKLGHARGVALLAVAEADLAVSSYPPAVVKRSIAGRGAADKAQVARLMRSILGLREEPPPDATDALAIALTHLHASTVESRVQRPASPRVV